MEESETDKIDIISSSTPGEDSKNYGQIEMCTAFSLPSKYPDFESLEKREKSFENFPEDCQIQPRGFAEAGFFYSGINDYCVCFHIYSYTGEFSSNHYRQISPCADEIYSKEMSEIDSRLKELAISRRIELEIQKRMEEVFGRIIKCGFAPEVQKRIEDIFAQC